MFHIPEYYYNMSMRLSQVLDDLGVSESLMTKRRRLAMIWENSCSLLSDDSFNIFNIFGSTSEGSTTLGLNSDKDILASHTIYNAIQDYSEWKPGHINLLMIQDDITSPGYCHLQYIRPDMPLPVTDIINEHCIQDAHGRILLKNTFFDDKNIEGIKNGPAWTTNPGNITFDLVAALSCESWPKEARDWLQRNLEKWPTEDMKRYVENSGCFVVSVDSKVGRTELLEWRISTSKAERCLMFNLNITQIRCYVLLKMILKTYLEHPVSSYMCKTILLRCIEKVRYNIWQENNLVRCLTVCLQALHLSILHESCPHYFIPGNNLMARQFSPKMKEKLLRSLHHILESQGAALYGIEIDDLGERLQMKMNPLYQSVQGVHLPSADDISHEISGNLSLDIALFIKMRTDILIEKENTHLRSPLTISQEFLQLITNFLRQYKKGTKTERKSLQLLVPFICSSLGTVLASVNIGTNHSVSTEALSWLSAGLNSDVTSGRLKLASVLYCAGYMLRAELILKETERLYCLDSVKSSCCCYDQTVKLKMEFCRVCYIQNEKAINSVCAVCVKFIQADMNCIPCELQYELFRSTEEERLHRDNEDNWMDTAVVDSLPFLYFLQYKTYRYLQRYNDKQRALECLALTINLDEDFGHRETALNLLGQCMEQENRLNDALQCYITSLEVRERNNAARFHLCRLLADMQNNS